MRWPRHLLVALSVLALVFVISLLYLYHYRNDEALAQYIMDSNNPKIRGRLEFRRIHWKPQAIIDMAMGVPSLVECEHFAAYDPRGKRVIYAPRASGMVELYPLLVGGGLKIHQLKPVKPTFLVEQVPGPGKLKIGFLETFASTHPHTGRRGAPIEFRDFWLKDAKVRLALSGWSVDLEGLESRGSFLISGGPIVSEGLVIDHTTRVRRGVFQVGGVKLPLKDLTIRRLGGLEQAPTRIDVDIAGLTAGSPFRLVGRLEGVYRGATTATLAADVEQAQRLAHRVVGGEVGVGGPATVSARLQGPLARPRIDGRVQGLALGAGATRLEQLSGEVQLDVAEKRLRVEDVKGRLMGGKITGHGRMNLDSGDWSGGASIVNVDPGVLHPLLAGRLNGKVGLKGGDRPLNRGLAVLDVQLARSRRDLLPRVVDLDGSIHLGREVVDLAGLRIRGDGNSVTARGSLNLGLKQTDLFLRVGSPRLGRWLAQRGLPAAVQSVEGDLHVIGRFPALRATGQLLAHGVGHGILRAQSVKADLQFADGTLRLKQLRSQGYGGRLEGEASLDIFEGSLLRPRKMPLLQAQLRAVGLDLTALGLGSFAIGRVFGDVEISGALNNLSGTAVLKVPRATIQGDRYEGSQIRLGILKDRISVYEGQVARADGGRISLWGDLYYDQRVDMRVSVKDFPVVGIPSVAHLPLGLGGKIHGRVNLTGTLSQPRLGGEVQLSRARLRGVTLGSGSLRLTPGSDSVRLTGKFFGDLLVLDGYLLTDPHPRLHLSMDLKGLPLEKLVHEVRLLGDVRGVVDGRVRLDLDSEVGLAWADARFSRAQLFLRYRPPGTRKVQLIQLSNDQDLLARYDGRQLHVVTARLVTTVGNKDGKRADFTLGGWLSSQKADMRLRGKIAVEILEFLLAKQVKKLEGDATADVRLSGTLDRPKLDGGLWLHGVRVHMPKFDTVIEVPQGQVRLVPGSLRLAGLKIRVGRQEMVASGKIDMNRFKPTMLGLSLAGEANFKLLELLFPEQISAASGAASVKINLTGPVQDPQLAGQLAIKRLEASPRGWGRTITLRKGSVSFSNYQIETVKPLEGSYDEGFLRLAGTARLDRWDLADINLQITGMGIPQRQPNVYSAELNFTLQLLGDSHQLELHGNVDLVDVRYVRKFELIRRAFIKPRVYEEEDPFWKGSPLLEGLKLRLTLRSTGQMLVKNEYAQLNLSGAFGLVGTLSEPRIGGQVRVEEGTFSIPFLRGEYTIQRGDIIFSKQRPVDEAELSITGETLHMDHTGVDYQIRLTLEGPLNRIGIKLSSNPPLEQGQIWALLVTGRTTQQLRTQLKGAVDAQGGAGGNQAAGAADAQVKQLTGEILNQIMVDPLKKVTKLDLLRFEMGTESAQVKAGKRLGRFVNLAGEAEVGLLGDSRAEMRLEGKIHDLLMLVGKLERISTRLETDDIDPTRGRLELKLRLPLR